jgi:methylated-DNA-[protein]-cysteine S-methyltransferase
MTTTQTLDAPARTQASASPAAATQPGRTEYLRVESPIGPLLLTGDGTSLTALHLPESGRTPPVDAGWIEADRAGGGVLAEAARQLGEYFAGERTTFDLPLAAEGTEFQQRVWAALRTIPYGATASYGEIAGRVGSPKASRAVGLANGRNPIAVVVPCHRVVGADGSLTGYGGGLPAKRTLLDLEAGLPLTG